MASRNARGEVRYTTENGEGSARSLRHSKRILAALDLGPGTWGGLAARDYVRCPQCHLPWFLHPEEFDPDEGGMTHCCTGFPVEPVDAVEACIVP